MWDWGGGGSDLRVCKASTLRAELPAHSHSFGLIHGMFDKHIQQANGFLWKGKSLPQGSSEQKALFLGAS